MTMNAWDDPHFVKAVEATGRKHLLFAGVTLQVCAALPAYSALAAGYKSYVVIDPVELERFSKTYFGIPPLPPDFSGPRDRISILPPPQH